MFLGISVCLMEMTVKSVDKELVFWKVILCMNDDEILLSWNKFNKKYIFQFFGFIMLLWGDIETLSNKSKFNKNRRAIWIVMFHFTITIFLIKYFVVFRVLKAQPEVNGGPICRTNDSQLELNNVQREKNLEKNGLQKNGLPTRKFNIWNCIL